MTRSKSRRFATLALVVLMGSALGACTSPFSEHSEDIKEAWASKARDAHRKWDRYVMGLDWDDPYHTWHDESYATGPMPR